MLPALPNDSILTNNNTELGKLFTDTNEFLKRNFDMIIHATVISSTHITFKLYDTAYGEKEKPQPAITANIVESDDLDHPILRMKSEEGRFSKSVYVSGVPALVATTLFAVSSTA